MDGSNQGFFTLYKAINCHHAFHVQSFCVIFQYVSINKTFIITVSGDSGLLLLFKSNL